MSVHGQQQYPQGDLPPGPYDACGMVQIFQAQDISITRVEWHKITVAPYHEYLLVYVEEKRSDGVKPRKSVIMIEREVSNLVAEKEVPREAQTNLAFWVNGRKIPPTCRLAGEDTEVAKDTGNVVSQQSFKFKSSKSPSTKTFSAANHLTFSSDGTDSLRAGQYHCVPCRRLSIDGAHMSVTQLAGLTRVVHEHRRSYKWLEYQFYWFTE